MKKDINNVKAVLHYEIDKINFYKQNNQEIGPIITEEYCEYEEEKYGNDLCKIYNTISDIQEGKKLINNILIQIIIVTIIYLITPQKGLLCYINLLYFIYMMIIIIKISNNSKTISCLAYLYQKAMYKLTHKRGK